MPIVCVSFVQKCAKNPIICAQLLYILYSIFYYIKQNTTKYGNLESEYIINNKNDDWYHKYYIKTTVGKLCIVVV